MRLFKNKSFNVKVVDDPPIITPPKPIDYEKIIWAVVKGTSVVIGVYMGADTARQIAINWTSPL